MVRAAAAHACAEGGSRHLAGPPGSLRIGRKRLDARWWADRNPEQEEGAGRCVDKAHLPPHPELLNVRLKYSSLFSLDEFAILMILIILKGQQHSFESPSVLSCNQLINWKPFSSVG